MIGTVKIPTIKLGFVADLRPHRGGNEELASEYNSE